MEASAAYLDEMEQKVEGLQTWGVDWPEWDAAPPSTETIQLAKEFIRKFYTDVCASGHRWYAPLITGTEESEAEFTWQCQGRRLSIIVGDDITYSKTWGEAPSFQFKDQIRSYEQEMDAVDGSAQRLEYWMWLVNG